MLQEHELTCIEVSSNRQLSGHTVASAFTNVFGVHPKRVIREGRKWVIHTQSKNPTDRKIETLAKRLGGSARNIFRNGNSVTFAV